MSNEPALNTFIHNLIMDKEADDQYELIYLVEKNKIIVDGKSFAELMTDNASSTILQAYGNNFFHEIENYSPLLSITMPDLDDRKITDWRPNVIPDVFTIFENDNTKFILYNTPNSTGVEHTPQSGEYMEPYLPKPTLGIIDAEVHYLINSDGVVFGGGNLIDLLPSCPSNPAAGPTDPNDCLSFLLQAWINYQFWEISGDEWYLINHDAMLDLYRICLLMNPEEEEEVEGEFDCELCPRNCEEEIEKLVKFKLNDFSVLKNCRNQFGESKYVFHGNTIGFFVNSEGSLSPFVQSDYVSGSYRKKDLFDKCADGGWFGNGDGVCDPKWIDADYSWWYEDWKLTGVAEPVRTVWSEVDGSTTTVNLSFPASFTYEVKATVPPFTTSTKTSVGLTAGVSVKGELTVRLGSQVTGLCSPDPNTDLNTGSITYWMN